MEISASDLVYEKMAEYAKDSMAHVFPSAIDGLTKVVRRLIWSAYPDRNHLQQLATLLTKTRILHVAGDTTIRTSADNHIQEWKTCIPIYHIEGTMGDYSGTPAGATRYLEGRLSEIAADVFFYKTNFNTLPMVKSDSGLGEEPAYLIPIIPTSLLNADSGIAIGYTFSHTPLNVNSVCELVKTYIRIKNKNPIAFKRRKLLPEIVQHLIPDPVVPGLLRNTVEVYNNYLQGNFDVKLMIDGIVDVTKNSIIIQTIPNGNISKIKTRIEKRELPNSNSWISKHFTSFDDFSKGNVAEHVLTVKRGIEPFKLLEDVKRVYGFTTYSKDYLNWLNKKDEKQNYSPLDLLELWYTERSKINLNRLRLEERAIINNIRKNEALILGSTHADTVFQIFKSSETPEDAASNIVKKFPVLSMVQARYLFEFNYASLTRINKDKLEEEINKLKKDLEIIGKDILSIDTVVTREVDFFQSKYTEKHESILYKNCLIDNSIRKVRIPNFKYLCKIRDIGYTQCFELSEIAEVIRSHGSDVELYKYPEGDITKTYIDLNNKIISDKDIDLPQTFAAKKVYYSNKSYSNTILIDKKIGNIVVIDKLSYRDDVNTKIFYIGDKFVLLNSSGELIERSIEDFTLRKDASALGIKTEAVYCINDTLDNMKDYVCIKVNKKIRASIFISKVKITDNSASIFRISRNEKILYFGPDDETLISIPTTYTSGRSNRYLYIKNLKRILNVDADVIMLDVSKFTSSIKGLKLSYKSLGYIKEVTLK